MQILSLNFLLYTIGGVWRPIEWSSTRSKLLYNLFTFYVICSLMFLLVTELLNILFVDNIDDCIMILMILLSIVSCICKMFIVIIRRDKIINIIGTLREKPCKACTEDEMDIQLKFDRLISSLLSLWLTSLQENIGMIMGTFINVATETSIMGFCLQMCAQFEILKHRLQRMVNPTEEIPEHFQAHMPKKTSRLSEHICHHLVIIRNVRMVNDIFSVVIFIQFFASILILCTSLYFVYSHTIADVAPFIIYAFCMFVQIFVYCWAGNEVMLQSTGLSEGVYDMDWTLMTINERRDLLMIMKRSMKSIKLTSSFLVTLSLESYSNLLKTSYSVFSLLQQT
ncbi:odorant receptor 46a isoform X2 [Ooceraea biroi]|uniref:odorant receptor 46a isoform X2 n=1 Tax=Ooceraea biroi TaxID=2015173 RepID=UPI000F08B880|nr:odorant receptor 46a isoform X2 [Ooceraea biroi]